MILAGITYQDLRSRSVSWILFPLLAGMGIILTFMEFPSVTHIMCLFVINSGFLLCQYFLLHTYYFIRDRRLTRIIDSRIGWGDLLFLLSACFFFSPLNFFIFYLGSLVFSIAIHLLMVSRNKTPGAPAVVIPLAGLQAGLLSLVLILSFFFNLPVADDNWQLTKYFLP